MSPGVLKMLTIGPILEVPVSMLNALDACNPRARRWQQAGMMGRSRLSEGFLERMFDEL